MGVFKWIQTILKAIFYNIKFCIELSDDTKNVEEDYTNRKIVDVSFNN
jgi:hypothetical protein